MNALSQDWTHAVLSSLWQGSMYEVIYPDPATPAFITGMKKAYGTDAAIAHIREIAGDEAIQVGDIFRVVSTKAGIIRDFSSEHINVWRCPYIMIADRVEYVEAELESDQRHVQAVCARFRNLAIADDEHPIIITKRNAWGPKYMYDGDAPYISHRLFQLRVDDRPMFARVFDDMLADG